MRLSCSKNIIYKAFIRRSNESIRFLSVFPRHPRHFSKLFTFFKKLKIKFENNKKFRKVPRVPRKTERKTKSLSEVPYKTEGNGLFKKTKFTLKNIV